MLKVLRRLRVRVVGAKLHKEIKMDFELNFITGLMLGAEYADFRDEGGDQFVVVDILFVRMLFIW